MLGRTSDMIRGEDDVTAVEVRLRLVFTIIIQLLWHAQGVCSSLALDALILIGGSTTHTDALYLSEYFLANNVRTRVVAVPASVDGVRRLRVSLLVAYTFVTARI